MASSPQHHPQETVQEESILLDRSRISVTLKQFCDNTAFFLVTLLIILDLVTDIWVIIVFGLRRDMVFMGVLTGLLVFAGLILTVAYSTQHRSEGDRNISSYINLCLNFPFQIGIIYQRCVFGLQKCYSCCPGQIAGHAHASGPRGIPSNLDWKFAKLKMIQSMFHCVPQLIGNILHILVYKDVHIIQIISGVSSFTSIIFGVVLHEKARKEQTHGALMGIMKVICILLYKTLVMGTRLLAIIHFIYYFGGWIAAVLVPHVSIILGFYLYLYRQIWKVQYHTIVLHSLYSMFAYFPIHSEYRPEGEIVMFYILFMVENIIMVALPFKVTPIMYITRPFHPTSRYYFIVMLTILVGATAGLIFMCAYYFLFHKSRHSIRETNIGWLARLCEWRKQDEDEITVTVSNGQNHAVYPSDLREFVPNGNGELSRDIQTTEASSYHTHFDGGTPTSHTAETDADLPSSTSLLNANIVKFVTSSANPESGSQRERLLVQGDVHQETANRPSVLEGDDDSDAEHDTMHIVV